MPRFSPVFAFIIAVFIAAATFGVALGVFGPPGVLLAPLLLAVGVDAVRRIRRRRASIVLGYLGQAVRLNLPLPTLIHAAAESEDGPMRRRLHGLADRLGFGDPLADALRDSVDDVDARSLRLIGVGEWSGRLGPTLEYLTRRLGRSDLSEPVRIGWVYVVFMLGFVLLLMVGLSVVVLPTFMAIMGDFSIATPPITRSLEAAMGSPILRDLSVAVALALAATFVIGSIAMVERVVFGVIPWGAPLRWARDAAGSVVPPLGAVDRDRALADLCFVLGEAMGAGLSPVTAANEAAQLDMPRGLRHRVIAWAEAMDGGRAIGDAARQAGLPRLMVSMIAQARTQDDMAAVFGFLGRHYEFRVARATALLRAAAVPSAVVVIGSLVAWVELAVLEPVRAILDATILTSGLAG